MSLQRQLLSGNEFSSLFPNSSCDKVRMGKGDTQTSIELMIKQIKTHYNQVVDVAPQLLGNDLAETCANIHWFLYNHFQYLADGEDQLLRSPACAWKMRKEGIDCKSYSIIASCLLINLGINHYIRKIKQPTFSPENYTHVYVIVPIDQKNKSLNKGYYTIDGTLPTTQEPTFTSFKDYFMEGLQHYALNGVKYQSALKGEKDYKDPIWGNYKNKFLSDLSFKYFMNPKCYGGTGFTEVSASQNMTFFNAYYALIFTELHKAIEEKKSNDELTVLINEIQILPVALWQNFEVKKGEGWNQCSRGNMESLQLAAESIVSEVVTKFNKWLNYYFDISGSTNTIYLASEYMAKVGVSAADNSNGPSYIEMQVNNYVLKPNITEVAVFEYTPYSIRTTANNFSIQQYIATAEKFIPLIVNGQTAYEEGNTDPSNTGNNNPSKDNKDNTLTYVGIAGLLFFGYKYISK